MITKNAKYTAMNNVHATEAALELLADLAFPSTR